MPIYTLAEFPFKYLLMVEYIHFTRNEDQIKPAWMVFIPWRNNVVIDNLKGFFLKTGLADHFLLYL